ncbi:MAG TPA: InlB B-repeat-containing protein, partial [Acholeplasma sp.]
DAVNPGIPPKMPTDYESFVFTGWDQAFTNITEDLEIYPEFRSELRSFIVIFKDDQGNILKEEFVVRGYSASAPTNIKEKPKNEYYEYIPKWDQDFTNVQSDLVITLYYEEIERLYYLRFFDDNNQLMLTITGTYNQYVDAPAAKEKPMTEQFIYHFVSWSPVFENYIKEDQDYYPIYDRTIRQYLVTFIDGDGNVFDEQYVAYGQQPQVPSGIPGKTSTQQYYYEFKMWETTTVKVYQDLEIHAVFNRYLQVYRVTFVDEFDNVLSYQLIPYGQGATEPDSSLIPDKPPTREYVYVFAGWDQSFSFITEDIVVKTVYIGTLRKYTYTFYDEDEVTILKQIVGAYGDPIIPPEAPTKPSTESSIFKFIGWHIPVQDILTEDVIYIARYQEVLRTYRVIFMDGNGFVFDAQVVNYGEAAKTPAGIPSKSPTTMYQFEFIGWIEDYSNVTSDLVINANFLRKLREFKVTFIADKDVYVFYVPYGGSAEGLIATPSKVGYRFIDWDQTLTFITKDTEVKAIFKPNSYYIEFDSGYEEGDVIPVTGSMTRLVKDFDSQVTLPSVGFEREGYVFIGWRKEGDDFISYFNEETFKLTDEGLKLYATWLAISYDIYYDLDGGEAINPTSYTVEDYIILQNAYKKDYRFIGWYLVDEQGEMLKKFKAASEIKVDAIYPGEFIGDITLVARYDYEGFIQLKDEYKDVLGLYYADITTRIPIEEREKYNDENPVYLIGWGVYLNMTIGELKSRFVNENLIVTDEDGNELTDDEIVATSQQIIVKNTEGIIIDRVHIVLYGDANGDGKINAIDSVEALNFISGKSDTVSGAKILSVDLNEDGKLNAIDTTQLLNHISGKWSLY